MKRNIIYGYLILFLIIGCVISKHNGNYKYSTDLYVYGEDNSLREENYILISPIKLKEKEAKELNSDVFSHDLIKEFRYYNQGDVFYIGNDVHSGSFINRNNYSPTDFFNVNYPELMFVYEGENDKGEFWKEVITKEIIYGYLVKNNNRKNLFDNILNNFENNNNIFKDSVVYKRWRK